MRSRRCSMANLCFLSLALILVPPAWAADTALAARIRQLLHTVLTTDNDADDAAAKAEMHKIFDARGLPTIAEVGDEAAYEFVVLAFYQQPADFRQRVLVEARQSAERHEIPPDALTFLETRAKLEEAKARARATPPTNPDLRDQIRLMAEEDQRVRQRKDFDPAKMEATDAENAKPLLAIIEKYGVPTVSMVGPKAATGFVVMAQHQPADFRERIVAGLKANVDAGEADPEAYALVYDRLARNMGRNQLYGTQLECTAGGTLAESPLDDPATVNQRRAKLGMLRLAVYEDVVRTITPDMCHIPPKQ